MDAVQSPPQKQYLKHWLRAEEKWGRDVIALLFVVTYGVAYTGHSPAVRPS